MFWLLARVFAAEADWLENNRWALLGLPRHCVTLWQWCTFKNSYSFIIIIASNSHDLDRTAQLSCSHFIEKKIGPDFSILVTFGQIWIRSHFLWPRVWPKDFNGDRIFNYCPDAKVLKNRLGQGSGSEARPGLALKASSNSIKYTDSRNNRD